MGFPFHLLSELLVLRDRFDFPLFLAFDRVRWRISEVRSMCFSLTIRRKKGGVENVMYLLLRWELESIGEWTQHFHDFECALSF